MNFSVWLVSLLLPLLVQMAWGQQFVQNFYFTTVQEEQPVGSDVVTVEVEAFNSIGFPLGGTFSIPTDGDARFFTIEDTGLDRRTGISSAVIRSAVVFDWDPLNVQRRFVFPVSFMADGASSSISVQVTVVVDDINDNAPRFSQEVFELSVFEQLPGGTHLLNLTAEDPDLSLIEEVVVDRGNGVMDTELQYTVENGRVTYQIATGNELSHFRINSENGTLSIAPGVQLDIDLVPFYNLSVVATDGGGLNDVAEVLITILDSNDNAPQILGPRGVDVTISEDTEPGYVIVEGINATDLDSGANSLISFFITSGVLRESFTIDAQSGGIIVSGPLDREVQSVLNLTVVARDHGVPAPLEDTIFVVVRLLDVNDFAPQFVQPSFTVTIREDLPPNTRVAQILAEDFDEGVNGTITYSIAEGGEGIFYIDSATGVLFANVSLDQEAVSSYKLVVMAIDNPLNLTYQLSSEVNVTVLVEDTNDNVPIFSQDSYNVSILDNVTRREPLIQIQATDADSGDNGVVTYRFAELDPRYPEAFRIDENTGIVRRNRQIRFENQTVFTYVINAQDNGPFPLSQRVNLTIFLHNVNENPPAFDELDYNTTLPETTPLESIVLRVSAQDPDVGLGPIGEVRYRIVTEFDEAGSFRINETSGDIAVATSLDFDFRDTIFFQVEAFDGGFPEPYTDLVNVTVFLTGSNDEPPVIVFPPGFQVFVPENTPPEVDVVVLREFTVDPDLGNQDGDFNFTLSAIFDPFSTNDSFSLNETTGLVRSLREFDRELQPEGIIVSIVTTDQEGRTRVNNITVLIGDMNDNSPYFESNVLTSIHEFLEPGTEVLSNYTALDEDIGSNADLRYALFDGVGREMFTVDPLTGGLFTAAVLNKTEQDFYNLTVIVMDQGTPQLFNFGTIFVEVLDSNDMVPTFTEDVYEASFSESDPIGTQFFRVNASDSDIGTNAEIQYFFAPNLTDSERFMIDTLTGEIFTDDLFDRENESTIELLVIAVDSGRVPHPLTGTATVLVTIEDYNEFTPAFNESFYEAVVTENAENGTYVAAVFATDDDATPPSNLIQYSLLGSRSDAFTIDPSVGVVTVAGEVDWEEGAEFNITVVASDSSPLNPLNSTVELMVSVLDVNDNPPMFLLESLNLSIEENTAVGEGQEVGFVRTTDADSPGNNSDVTYTILMDFTRRKFILDNETGLVTFVRGTLNRERRPSYDLLIRATDHGSPALHTDATLTITVADANDFDPVFDSNLYTASVPEMAPEGTSVVTIHAEDGDSGSNADLVYSIINPPRAFVFDVNETSGVIFVSMELDFESNEFYHFDVMVSDGGEQRRNATASVEITVTDSNDLLPQFNQSQYSALIRENLAPYTTLLRVFATDDDTDVDNKAIEYSLESDVGDGNFGIDPETGVVYTTTSLDREDIASYNLTVTANNSRTPYPLSTTVQLLVTVTDLNDNHPTFPLLVEVAVLENEMNGAVVHVLSAEDGDEGENGTVTYTLRQPSEQFNIDPTSGVITLLQSLDYEADQKQFILPIIAIDSGNESLSNYTNVLISVLDANDQPPRFASRDYSVSANSETNPGVVILTLQVSDADSDSDLTFRIVSGGEGVFGISDSGVISTTASLRSHVGRVFVLTVEASDSRFQDEANVTVYVQDSLATTRPFFDSRTYTAQLSESAQDGHVVMEFAGVTQNEDSYVVDSEIFAISSVGSLSVRNSSLLDFETTPVHQVTVGIENSAGSRSFAVLTVQVTDEDEHAPEFISDRFLVRIPETTPVGSSFFSAIAYDRDGSSPADDITYDISQTDPVTASCFQIDSRTGALSLTRPLMYESNDTGFNVTVTATNPGSGLSSSVDVEILVLNGNSFDPVFSEAGYRLFFREDFPSGISILNVTAFDRDIGSYGDITFGLDGDHRYLDFRIDTFSGEIFTNEPLDYERKTFYHLDVVAADGGNPGRSTIVPLEIFIIDLNDNTPIWDQELYTVDIVENVTVGFSVIRVSAPDIDSFEPGQDAIQNGRVTFSITQGDLGNNFDVDPDTGVVSVVSSLDRESYPEYNLTLNATDGGGLFSNAYLQIIVHDANDVTPTFVESPFLVCLSEDAEIGTTVLTIRANDTDLSRNSEILYHFEDEGALDFYDSSATFFLNDTTGVVTLQIEIDREDIAFYNVTVVAVDMGEPRLTGTTQLLVNILDINEFAPEFTQDGFFGEVFENEPQGVSILQVSSTDLDFEENSTVFYSIVSGGSGIFAIDMEDGIISVAGPLDFEVVSEYELIVMATDTGPASGRLINITNVTISILDRNDNPPVFSEVVYFTSVSEDSIPGDLVLNASASDADSGSNSELEFTLNFLSDSEAEANFIIDAATGSITLSDTANLDRERTPSYDIIVEVADRGTPSLNSTAMVTIEIADANDHTPQFTRPYFEGSVDENSPSSTSVAQVSATDEDIGNNSIITYSIARTIDADDTCLTRPELDISDCIESIANDNTSESVMFSSPPFFVDMEGVISTSFPLDRENISIYLLEVVATDSGPFLQLSNTSFVVVRILDQNDQTPTFTESVYYANISEYSVSGELVLKVLAEDSDLGSNADVVYSLSDSQFFTVNMMTGGIFTMARGYDRESRDQYNLTVIATDRGTPSLTSSAVVVVSILDENDSPPMFSESLYLSTVRESLPSGTFVIQLNATDADIGINSVLTFSILSSSPFVHFSIDPSSGELSTTDLLDRETVESYTITVLVADGGEPSLNSTAQVEVTVEDLNDFPPVFSESSYAISVNESSTPLETILTISATDSDLGTNAEIFFAIVAVNPVATAFEIGERSGDLRVTSPLDAEVSLFYNITVRADNGPATPYQSIDIVVGVDVVDLNDNAPMFEQLDYILPYLESNPPGSVVVNVSATDFDATPENSELSFEIIGGFNTSLFSIATVDGVGVVSVAGVLDRETDPRHTLEVAVFDNGSPQLSATTSVVIILQDANDNSPVFEQSAYIFSFAEDANISTLVGRIRANDIDQQNVSYYLNDTELFTIDDISGEIFTAAEFDREEQPLHSIIAVATDRDQQAVERTAEVTVNITILDVNDVTPFFTNSTYFVFVPENTPTGSEVSIVEALDSDLGESGSLSYFILPSNDSSFFSVNMTTGQVFLEMELDRETQDVLEFTVTAADSGMPSLTGTAIVVVMVLDHNDNIPVLNASSYAAALPEDTPTGTEILTVGASDLDIDENADISYSLLNDFAGTFSVDDRSGIISLSRSLDYESSQSYRFFVVAADNGSLPLSSSSEVLIEVLDLNDNPPIFDSDVYFTSLPENSVLGTLVFQLPATDADSTSNGALTYSLLSGSFGSVFSVNEASGDVFVADYLDREIIPSYSLDIRVVDNGVPQFTATTTVEVTVLDVNDHIPIFDSKMYSCVIPESSTIGTEIFTFVASDLDIGSNANLSYSIASGNVNEAFEIGSNSGILTLSRTLDAEVRSSYGLSILVSDNGSPEPLIDTATMRIIVTDENEFPPTFPEAMYYVNISQNTVVGSPIGHFKAEDLDAGSRGTLTYNLLDGLVHFEVDTREGTVYVIRALPPGAFQLTLNASDGVFYSSINISVTVMPFMVAMMASPLFNSSAYFFEVSEAAEIGTVVGAVSPSNAYIYNVDGTEAFSISSTGEVVVRGNLDYETTPFHVLNIVASGNGMGGFPIYAVMTIAVLDANDNPPLFESGTYTVALSESLPSGSALAALQAFDIDEVANRNSEFTFSLSNRGNERGEFAVDPSTGVLSLAVMLDYEANSSHVLTAVVTNDQATPILSSFTQIFVTVIDENDNSPQFSEMFYRTSIPESTPVGTSILNLEASDADSGTNSELVFSITHLSEPLIFVINQTTGVVATNATFNLDAATLYIASASVADRGNPQPLAASTTIFIEVVPDNVSPPVFSQLEGYSVEVPETLNVGGPILQVSASDGTEAITYSIESDCSNAFSIDPSTGLVTLSSSLDFEVQAFYSIVVLATDSGTPPQSSAVLLNVTVSDENNHDPQFSQNSYTVSVYENITVGTSVIQVSATDSDTSNITYQITVNYYTQGVASFSINPVTGVIMTTTEIDREADDVIELLVSAIDSGYLIRRSTSVPVIIDVLDLNDNPPVFVQSEYSTRILRLLSAGKFVIQVLATDADRVGEELVYSISSGNHDGRFSINNVSGVIETAARIPETTPGFQLNVSATDGTFVSTVMVNLLPGDDGDFCEDNGFCTSVREVNCTIILFNFVECEPVCTLPYELSLERRVCVDYSCIESSLVPCVATETCLPVNVGCNDTCPAGMSLCPTTNLCHMTSLSESCDDSNVTCLVSQSLVQRQNGSRSCLATTNLPPAAELCTDDDVFCVDMGLCMNRSTPDLCQPCPGHLLACPGTGECVSNLSRCCSAEEMFCDTLSSCLLAGQRCELPNIAPIITSDLIFLGSQQSEGGMLSGEDGHVISVTLGDPGFDSQGEEVSLAVTGASSISVEQGEWQYALNSSSMWVRIDANQLSDTAAVLLPSSAHVRFIRRSLQLEGAVWLRAKLWDGNADGYLSPRQDLVRSATPRVSSTLPFTPTSAFSEDPLLLAILLHPVILPPSFNAASTHFSSIQEDVSFSQNFGNSLLELVLSVDVVEFPVLPDNRIEGFPASSDEQLLPVEVRGQYYASVRGVNPTRVERQLALQSGQLPGVAVEMDSHGSPSLGVWQVAFSDDPKLFLDLDSVLTNTSDVLLLNTSARLRFLPSPNYCGVSSILLAPWDGFWNSSLATQLDSGFILTSSPQQSLIPSLSQYNLNAWIRKEVVVECEADPPQVLVPTIQTSPIPYRLAYRYERLFTILVDREEMAVRREERNLANFLQITVQHAVTLVRFSRAEEGRTLVSFNVEDNALDFGAVEALLSTRLGTLAMLGFLILNISQDASYGPGAGCSGVFPTHYHGDHVNSLISTASFDAENDFLGAAVVGAMPTNGGVWQYHRGDWTTQEDASGQYDQDSNIWINFPSSISDTNALLLHGNDRVRFLSHPNYFWDSSASDAPSITVKLWDNSLGLYSSSSSTPTLSSFSSTPSYNSTPLYSSTPSYSSSSSMPPQESAISSINTNPLVDTVQSLHREVGLFSVAVVTVRAARYGCDGELDSRRVHDPCCVCGGRGDRCAGCDGIMGSNVERNACDQCGGSTSCLGCDWIPFSGSELRQCEVCLSRISVSTSDLPIPDDSQFSTSSFTDCRGDCHGNAILDDCGVCSGGQTSHDFNSDMDCAMVCFGNSTIDTCGACSEPQSPVFNSELDCTGVCGGEFRTDSCGVCQLPGEGGVVRENRDCSGECFGSAELDGCGVCYGGRTGVIMDSARDVCGVCHGNSSMCVGCDGGVASGRSVDRCGQCGGNNCGCFLVSSLSPSRGPTSGGTQVLVQGAGFFLNDSSRLPGLNFDPSAPNCGAPTRFPSGSGVGFVCRFSLPNEQLRVAGIPVSQGEVICPTNPAVSPGFFSVQISVNGGPFSNSVPFQFDDYSTVSLNSISPVEWELESEPIVTFYGSGFINSSFSACLVYDLHTCSSPPSQAPPTGYTAVTAIFESSSEVRCVLPAAATPCRVRVRLSFDGQESGRVESSSINFIFTYRFTSPQVTDISFTGDLSGLSIQFDRPAETTDPAGLSCTNIFTEATLDLIGGAMAACSWSNSRQDGITVALPTMASVKVLSPITFQNGAIETRRTAYSFSITNLTVLVSPDAVGPIAIVNGPSSIPFCGEVSFSGSHSLHPGYSGFDFYWSVLVRDSTTERYAEISHYLNSLPTNSSTISLNSNLFLASVEYYLQLYVENAAGVRSETENVLLLKDASSRLQVDILGLSNRSIIFGEQLVLNSLILGAPCVQEGDLGVLNFNWELRRVLDERRNITIAEDISNIKTSPEQVTVPAEIFVENGQYRLSLTVSSTSFSGGMGRAEISVRVLPLPLVVRIHGGNRTVSNTSELVLDARNSTYSSVLATPPTFTWLCSVADSHDACYNQTITGEGIPIPILVPNSAFVSIPRSTLTAGRSYVFTLRLEQGGRVATDTVVIQVVGSGVPVVEVSSLLSEVPLSEEVTLSGFVFSALPLRGARWESVQQEGFGFLDLSLPGVVRSQTIYEPSPAAATPDDFTAAYISRDTINRVNLVLSPQTLDPKLSYVFRLTAENDVGSSYAEVTIEVDSPPSSAVFTVTPSSGVAMETSFEVTVSRVLDSAQDSPFLYQFGVVVEGEGGVRALPASAQEVVWVSAVQSSPTLQTILPSGDAERNHSLTLLTRVFDRKGGYSDTLAEVTVLPNPSISNSVYNDRLRQLQSELADTKDWSGAVSQLVVYLTEINKNAPTSAQSLKEHSFEIFTSIFSSYISPSTSNYLMASSLLSLITSNQGIQEVSVQRQLSTHLFSLVEWFKNETALVPSFQSIPRQDSGEPLQLQSSYVASEKEPLPEQAAEVLLSPWIDMLESSSDPEVLQMFARGSEVVSEILCRQSSTGELPSFFNTSLATVHIITGLPAGLLNLSGPLVDFDSSVVPLYQSHACRGEGVACLETCVAGISFSYDFSVEQVPGARQTLVLKDMSRQKVSNEIEGSNPRALQLISEVMSLSISIPFQDAYLPVSNLASPIEVLVPVSSSPLENNSVPLCIYREVGGASGFGGDYTWLVDSTTPPSIVIIGSEEFYSCSYHHLSQFAIGLLPPPVITDPPPTDPPSTTPPPTTMTTPRTIPTTATEAVTESGSVAGPVAAIVVILVALIVAAILIVIIFLYLRNKKRKMKVLPDESASEEKEEAELVRAGPLTPAESKVLMDIIQCLEEGKRTRLGKMNVLPSIRLRELRFDIVDNFPSLKNKPFYFLTRQLCDIDPTTEQQQFVSIVFGEKPIFIREVTAENMQTKKHFCVCGNAAQFECSNCLSQGYCSPECQHSHWADKHQKECNRLSERKRRTDVLYNRQSTVVSPTSLALSPISETPQRAGMGLTSPTSPTVGTPTDWKGFMSLKRTMGSPPPQGHFPPPRSRTLSVPAAPQNITSLGTLAKRLSVPADQAPPTTATPSLGPLKRVPGALNLPADSATPSTSTFPKPRPSFIGGPTPLTSISPGTSVPAASSFGRSPLQSPLYAPTKGPFAPSSSPQKTQGALFVRAPPQVAQRTGPAPSRHLSIQSVGSADFAVSPHAASSIRSDPLLESDEEDYTSSGSGSSSEGEGEESRRGAPMKSPSSRPPSLAVRRRESRVSSSSSTSSDEESEEEDSKQKT